MTHFFTIYQKRISLDYNTFRTALQPVATKTQLFNSSTPILERLHWLPVKFHIHFKICTITFRTLKYNQPQYLADLLVRPKCSKYQCCTNSNRFVVPRIKTNTGSRAFSKSGPALWNSGNYLNLTYSIWLSHPISSAASLPVDKPALASIMIYDHAEDLCASELGPLRI